MPSPPSDSGTSFTPPSAAWASLCRDRPLRARALPSRTGSGVLLDPDRAVLGVLLLPDRHDALELVDPGARGGERGIAMRRRGRHDHRDVADREVADAVVHGDSHR